MRAFGSGDSSGFFSLAGLCVFVAVIVAAGGTRFALPESTPLFLAGLALVTAALGVLARRQDRG